MKKLLFHVIFWGVMFSSCAYAQEGKNPLHEIVKDDLGDVSDVFQEHFFEALKQKAIENYDKAIISLEKCKEIDPDKAVVYFELGKNYNSLKKHDAAIVNLQKANRLSPNKEWILIELLDAYFQNEDYEQAIIIVQNLIQFNNKYNDNLANLYFRTKQYGKLISLLDKLDNKLGISEYRNSLRQQIYALTNNSQAQIETLKQAILVDPENEKNYLNLIFVYSENEMDKEAFKTAEEMRKLFPVSKVVHLALYKFYLNSNNTENALKSMTIVLEAEEIDAESKFKVLNDFLLFVNENPVYEKDLESVAAIFADSEKSPQVFQKLGEYYLSKNKKEQALKYFELGLSYDANNLDLIQKTLLLQLDFKRFSNVSELSERALEIFPSQPLLYLIKGTSLNNLQEFKEAIEILTFGLDYIIDDPKMTIEFYEQMLFAYRSTGNGLKVSEMEKKLGEYLKTVN